MAKAIEVSPTGVRINSLAENVEEQHTRMRALLGEDLSLSPQTPQAQIAGINALQITEVCEAIAANAMATSVDHAAGVALDALGSNVDIERAIATRSRVTVTVAGVAGVGVPAGSRARTDPAGDAFRTLTDVILSPGGITVDMEAIAEGPVPALAGTLTDIVSVIAGWETITNPADAVLGVDRQGDDQYRRTYKMRVAQSSVGPLAALEAALHEARAERIKTAENNTDASITVQEWIIRPNSILTIAESGTEGDITRAVENHRGMGVGTMTAISGGDPDNTALDPITSGTVNFDGADYTGLDLSASGTPALKAAALSALLGDAIDVAYADGRYLVSYQWRPNYAPRFGAGTVETAFGLDPASGAYPPGPFARPRGRELTITIAVTRRTGFPADGIAQIRAALLAVVAGYGIGEEAWLNDFLSAVERVGGTRVTALTVQHDSADISGVAVPLDAVWTLALADLAITVT